MNSIIKFNTEPFINALKAFFDELKVPVNYLADEPASLVDILGERYKATNETHKLIADVYALGMVNDAIFEGTETFKDIASVKKIKVDYDGLLIFGVILKKQPTRSQFAEITRIFNQAFPYTPVTIVFKNNNYISISNSERFKYKQEWREGEKVGKVSLLMNVDCSTDSLGKLNTHQGHKRILKAISIDAIKEYDRKNKVANFSDLYKGWQQVFNTNVLNEQFYKDYQELSVKLIRAIYPSKIKDKLKAHQGALNLLNRMMFVCFIQKKGWLMNDPEFLFHFWQEYNETKDSKNSFHEKWINKVFFKAFNGKAFNDPEIFKILPAKYHTAILEFPYLNGGLFSPNDEDNFVLEDKVFADIYNFLQGYIFTISEDTADEINLEINPELLGKMYEGMINATDLNDVDAENGIVYTERPEINFMTRRSFVEVLNKKLPNSFSREFLYHFCFDKPIAKLELLKKFKVDISELKIAILSITALDPSCGSGSMLIGIIQLQVELIRTIDEYDGKAHTPKDDFYLKKQIISESIYGVDIKEWAVRIAELRFWLYMIAEAEFSTLELTKEPLLPNLDFKLRQGNSLMQEIGNLDFSIKGLFKGRKRNAGASRKLNEFIKKKKDFIANQSETKTNYKKLKEEELVVFKEFIKEIIFENNSNIIRLSKGNGQQDIFGSEKKGNLFEAQIEDLEKENEQLNKILSSIKSTGRIPFSYDIDFMEIFLTKEDSGFDLIIGNPPYVRQEDILPAEDAVELERLLLPKNKAEKADVNKTYKEKLSAKVYETYPFLKTKAKTQIDGKNKTIDIYGSKVPGRSDLYVYFQLLIPSLLNTSGTFCFIISNSWLDVEYGGFVQQFLLKHTQLHAIYDCNVRSFSAKVNTIIYFHSAIINSNLTDNQYKTFKPVGETIKFVMNKADYTDTAFAPLLLEQEHCTLNTFRQHYRIILKTPQELWTEGYDEEASSFIGDKWGGKWLHSPEIYFNILLKGVDKICKMKDLITYSQRNTLEAFDYFEETKNPNEKDIPFLDSSKILNKIYHSPKEISHHIKLKSAKYKQGFKKYKIADVLSNRFIGDRIFFVQGDDYVVGDTFFVAEFKEKKNKELYLASLNSTISILNVLVTGRKNMGDGVLLFYGPEFRNLQIVLPNIKNKDRIEKVYSKIKNRQINVVLDELGFIANEPIRNQQPNPLNDRKDLDNIIFDELGLTQMERNEVYWSVAELIKQRFDKAASR
nr:hypothetical protein [Pseudopedobacter sp.]